MLELVVLAQCVKFFEFGLFEIGGDSSLLQLLVVFFVLELPNLLLFLLVVIRVEKDPVPSLRRSAVAYLFHFDRDSGAFKL